MWFATRDGLNRYDGNAFVVYKNNPKDSGSLSSNFLQDLMQDDHGHPWIATNIGVNKFDPETERCTRYLHDPHNPNSLGGASVKSIAQGSLGSLWFGTEDSGLDKLDPTTGTFTHYRNDSDGHFVGRISQVIEDRHREIVFPEGLPPELQRVTKRLSFGIATRLCRAGDWWSSGRCLVRRLYSTFAGGWPGTALLLCALCLALHCFCVRTRRCGAILLSRQR